MKNIKVGFVLLPSIIMLLVGCGVTAPTLKPPYIHYTPSKSSNFHLEFDYPSSWTFSEENIQNTDLTVIGLGDPRILTIPTRAPNEPHGTPSDFGSVGIYVEPLKFDQPLDTLVEPYKQGHSDKSWITPLDDYMTRIDGYDAIVLEYQIKPLFEYDGYTSFMFERDIFFVVKDQGYRIAFSVAENERGDEFEKGYEYFYDSLKIVP